MDYGAELFGMIERVLAGGTSVADFADRFYYFYLDEVPDDVLSGVEQTFVERVCEMLDMTEEAPDAESRSHGFVDRGEFLTWLRQTYAEYETREAS